MTNRWNIIFIAKTIVVANIDTLEYQPQNSHHISIDCNLKHLTLVATLMMLHRGWEDMSNFTKEFQQPFQLYREGGSTYLQVSKYWL